MDKNPQQKIADILLETANEKGRNLANDWRTLEILPRSFQFRNYGLSQSGILNIGQILQEVTHNSGQEIESISLSYNSIADKTMIELAKLLPNTLTELGLVGCGLTDEGGKALLHWLRNNTSISMLCIEQNFFSTKLKSEFQELVKQRQNLILII